MKLIEPSFEIWKQPTSKDVEQLLNGMYDHVARCTRVCYQSKPREGESSKDFVLRTICKHESNIKNHLAMLEHATVYLTIPIFNKSANAKIAVDFYSTNKYTKWRVDDFNLYVTTNLRVIYENCFLADLEHICPPSEFHPKRVTVSFTTNIGVTREFNRHRVNSIAEESTRYCNYNKRNDGQIKIGLPAWLLDKDNIEYVDRHSTDELHSYCTDIADGDDIKWCDIDYYLFALTCAEYCYNNLIAKGWKPQQAREVLPLATKAQLIHTAFVDDWKHFFALRADGVSGPPHPNAKLVAEPLKEEFIKRNLL